MSQENELYELLKLLSIDSKKLILEQTEKKYNLLLSDDQTIRARIQSVNAISIGLIVLLVSIIHNKDWENQSNNYFIVLVIFLLYNFIIFFLTYFKKPDVGTWTLEKLQKDATFGTPVSEQLPLLYASRIVYYEQESKKISHTIRIVRRLFLYNTLIFGLLIVCFYYFTYWI